MFLSHVLYSKPREEGESYQRARSSQLVVKEVLVNDEPIPITEDFDNFRSYDLTR